MRYSTRFGVSSAYYYTVLSEFWKAGLQAGAGVRLPFCLFCDHNEFWLFGEYNRFPFKNNAGFPIDSLTEESVVTLSGDAVRIYALSAGAKIFLRSKWKRVVPYTYIGYGYLKRTDMIVRSESDYLPYARVKYSESDAWFWSLGVDIKIIDRMRIYLELAAVSAETYPSITEYRSFALGASFR